MTPGDSVTVVTKVGVDPETAFEVFTGEIGAWWARALRPGADPLRGRVGRMRLEPGVGGRLLEVHGEADVDVVGTIRVWEPARRLVFEWTGDDPVHPTEVEVTFQAIASGTRVTLEHRGWARAADESFKRMIGNCWLERLDEVKARAERRRGA